MKGSYRLPRSSRLNSMKADRLCDQRRQTGDQPRLSHGKMACMNIRQLFLLLTPGLLLPLAPGTAQAQAAPKADPLHAWIGATTPAALTAWISERLAAEQKDLDALMAVKGT